MQVSVRHPQHAPRRHLCARTRRTAPELPAAVPGLLAAPRFRQHPHSCAPHPRTPRTPLAAVIACSSVQRARRPRLRTRPSPVFSPRHAFAITHCSAPDVLVFAHDRPRSSRRATNPHVLDPTRPRAPPCGQSCRLTRPPTLLARTPRRHSSLHGAAALHHTTSHSSLDATQPPQCPFSGPYTIGPPVLLLLQQQLRCYSNFENDNLRFSSGLFSTPAVCVLRTT